MVFVFRLDKERSLMGIQNARILFIGDSVCGVTALEKFQNLLSGHHITPIFFREGIDTAEGIRKRILQQEFCDILISFCSEVVLGEDELKMVVSRSTARKLVVNIRGGDPEIPGVGYDTIPLIQRKESFASTLHFIEDRKINTGPIIKVERSKTDNGVCFREFKNAHFLSCMKLLGEVGGDILHAKSLEDLAETWERKLCHSTLEWQGPYISARDRDYALARLFQMAPDHRVFCNHPSVASIRQLARTRPRDLETKVVQHILEDILW